MTIFDPTFERLRRYLLKCDAGIHLWRFAGWAVARIAPYTPPRSEIPPERACAFVKVEVRLSTIPEAGHGLFALEEVEAGVRIGEYAGDMVDSVFKVLRLPNKEYVASTGDPFLCIDPSHRPEVMMRYICHHPDKEKRNVRFVDVGPRKFVESTRRIASGEEFLTDYSDLYWRLRGITPNGN